MNIKKLMLLSCMFSGAFAREKAIGRFRNVNVANQLTARSIRVRDLNVEGVASFGSGVTSNNIVTGPTNSRVNEIAVFSNATGNKITGSGFLMPTADGAPGQFLATNGAGQLFFDTPVGGGNVTSANIFTTDNALIRVDLPSGARNIQQSGVVLDDADNISGLNGISADNITVDWIQTGPGNAASPAVRVGDATTGLSSNAQNLSFTTSGAEQFKIDAAGVVSIPNGLNGFAVAGVVHNTAAGQFYSTLISNGDVAANAGIVDTKLATIATAGKVANSATTANIANSNNTIVLRDASGNFAANVITANTFNGAISGTGNFTSITNSGPTTLTALNASQAVVTDASKNLASIPYASANTATAFVQRDGSGNFSAGTITANLTGNVMGNVTGNVTGSVNLNGGTISNGSATFTNITDSGLTAGQAVVTDGSSQLASLQYTSSANPSTIASRDGAGRLQVQDPVANLDAANKEYVDAVATGLQVKAPVVAVETTTNVTLSGPTTIDGVAVVAGDRVLLTSQTNGVENGIWVVQTGAWTRPADFADGSHAAGAFVFVQQGTVYHDTQWVDTNNPPADIVGTDDLTWVEFSSASQTTGANATPTTGTGLVFRDKTGNTLVFRTLLGTNHVTITNATPTNNEITIATDGTSANTVSTLVARDGTTGGFLAGDIQATKATISAGNTATSTAQLTVVGTADINNNLGNAFAVNINTGTETGATSIGNTAGTLTLTGLTNTINGTTNNISGTTNFSGTVNMLTQNEIRFNDAAGGQYVGINAQADMGLATYTLSLPTAAPTINQVLSAGSGTPTDLTWQSFDGIIAPPATSEMIYVSKAGNNTTGNGSLAAPYLTLSRALTDANALGSLINPVTIYMDAGIYAEDNSAGPLQIIAPEASIVGVSYNSVIVMPMDTTQGLLDVAPTDGTIRILNIAFGTTGGSTNYGIQVQGGTALNPITTILSDVYIFEFQTGLNVIGAGAFSRHLLNNCFFSTNGTGCTTDDARVLFNTCFFEGAAQNPGTPANVGLNLSNNSLVDVTSSMFLRLATAIQTTTPAGLSALIRDTDFQFNDVHVSQAAPSNLYFNACSFAKSIAGATTSITVDGTGGGGGSICEMVGCTVSGKDDVGVASGTGIAVVNGGSLTVVGGVVQFSTTGVQDGNGTDVSTTVANLSSLTFHNNTTDIAQDGTATLNFTSGSAASTKITINDPINVTLSFSDVANDNSLFVGKLADVNTTLLQAGITAAPNNPELLYMNDLYTAQAIVYQNNSTGDATLASISGDLGTNAKIAAITPDNAQIAGARLMSDMAAPVGGTTALRGWDINKAATTADLEFDYQNSDTAGQATVTQYTVMNLSGINNKLTVGGTYTPNGTPSTTGSLLDVTGQTFNDNATAASGTAPAAVFTSFETPTLTATNTGVTTTDAATVYIAGAPVAGTNETITNSYALWIASGAVRIDSTSPTSLTGNPLNLNVNAGTNATNINTGTSTGIVNLGNSAGGVSITGDTMHAGDIAFNSAVDRTIYMQDDATAGAIASNSLTVQGTNRTVGTGNAGAVSITAGVQSAGAAAGNGGALNLSAGNTNSVDTGSIGGAVTITAGNSINGNGGDINLTAGTGGQVSGSVVLSPANVRLRFNDGTLNTFPGIYSDSSNRLTLFTRNNTNNDTDRLSISGANGDVTIFTGRLNVVNGSATGGGLNVVGDTDINVAQAGFHVFLNNMGATGDTDIGNTTGTLGLTGSTANINNNTGGAQTVNINSGTSTGNTNIGNTTGIVTITNASITSAGATSLTGNPLNLNVDAGSNATNINTGTTTGPVHIADGAVDNTISIGSNASGIKSVTIGGTGSTSGTAIVSGTTGIGITANNGPIGIISGTGTIGISTDATNTTVNIATGAGVKNTTVGSTNTTSTTIVQSGSGAVQINNTANDVQIAAGGSTTATVSIGRFGSGTGTTTNIGGNYVQITGGNGSSGNSIVLNGNNGTVNIPAPAAAVTAFTVAGNASAVETVVITSGGGTNRALLVQQNGSSNNAIGVTANGSGAGVSINATAGTGTGLNVSGNTTAAAITVVGGGSGTQSAMLITGDIEPTGLFNLGKASGPVRWGTLFATDVNATGTGNFNLALVAPGTITAIGTYTQAVGVTNAPVIIDSTGLMGTTVSSIRFKENVQDMADASDAILQLRPVTFNYKADAAKTRTYGLIAEEVEQIMPGLVVRDAEQQIHTVKYHELPILLLNELQKQQLEIKNQKTLIDQLIARVQTLEGRA